MYGFQNLCARRIHNQNQEVGFGSQPLRTLSQMHQDQRGGRGGEGEEPGVEETVSRVLRGWGKAQPRTDYVLFTVCLLQACLWNEMLEGFPWVIHGKGESHSKVLITHVGTCGSDTTRVAEGAGGGLRCVCVCARGVCVGVPSSVQLGVIWWAPAVFLTDKTTPSEDRQQRKRAPAHRSRWKKRVLSKEARQQNGPSRAP